MGRKKKKILLKIKDQGYITPQELKEIWGRRVSVYQLRIPGIREIRFNLGRNTRIKAHELFGKVVGCKIWYIDEGHPGFQSYLASVLPPNISRNMRISITRWLKNQRLSPETIHKIYAKKGIIIIPKK